MRILLILVLLGLVLSCAQKQTNGEQDFEIGFRGKVELKYRR